MVNQVVNTSLKDTSITTPPSTQDNKPEAAADFVASTQNQYPSTITSTADSGAANDDTLDLNQIMQNAMAMVFQSQNDADFDENIVEDFNRGLGDLSVSDLLPQDSLSGPEKKSTSKNLNKSEKKSSISSKKSSKKASKDVSDTEKAKISSKPKKPSKSELSQEKKLRKRYGSIASEAASVARKKRWAKNKELKEREKLERQTAREERRQKKRLEKQKLAEEQEELTLKVVDRGPPYPPDLRLTKAVDQRTLYLRWTHEELLKRSQEAGKTKESEKRKEKKGQES